MRINSKFTLFLFLILFSTSLMAQTSWNYISPKPGSKYINPENNIAFRHGDVLELESLKSDMITVRSSTKGEINGSFKLSADMRTLIFLPDENFNLKDRITVSLDKGIKTVTGLEMEAVEFSFSVKEIDNAKLLGDYYEKKYMKELTEAFKDVDINDIQALPQFGNKSTMAYPEDYPAPYVTEFDDPAPGYLFNTTFSFNMAQFLVIPGYNMIIDKYGVPVFYRKYPNFAIDLSLLPGNRLAVGEGNLNPDPMNKYIVLDSHFNPVDSLYMGNGYMVDPHDLQMDANGNHFMMAYDPQPVGMDTVVPGGDPNATVIGLVIQELDVDNNVIFQWRSWDHYEITDANDHVDLTAPQVDYVHGNAIEVDTDGNVLMSQRGMDEITKVDRNTGEIIWRFGVLAKNNEFNFINDTIGFSHQHDIRRIANGNLTVYDNGNFHTPPFSQSVEYEVDEVNKTAELVWNYINQPPLYAQATGSSRRLENSNVLIGWGFSFPISYTEVTEDKRKTWELNFGRFGFNYRGIKDTWTTDLFETNVDTIDYGEYDDYVAWPRIVQISNNSDEDIQITSTHNHWDSYYISTALPLTVPANGTANLTVNLLPTQAGQINDVLTLNYETMFLDSLPQCISRQIVMMSYVEDPLAPNASMNPADSATGVSQLARPVISFDEPVEKAGGGTIKATDIHDLIIFKEGSAAGEDVAFGAYMDAWKTTITIMPDTLKPLTDYYLELKPGVVQDGSGNLLADAVTAVWTTEEEQGIEELEEIGVSMYPNPTAGISYLQFDKEIPVRVDVISITGRYIMGFEDLSDRRLEINLEDRYNGLYIVRMYFKDSKEPRSIKLLKQ